MIAHRSMSSDRGAAHRLGRRSLLGGAAAVGGGWLLSGCGTSQPTASSASGARPITITDQRGKKMTFDGPVSRIVTVPMPAASLAVAVDRSADHLVGMHQASWAAMRDGIMGQMFPRTVRLPHDVASEDFTPNVESILALRPDVVVQWADEGTGIIAPMERAGLVVVGVTYGTQADVDTWQRIFAAMLGKPDRAKAISRRSAEMLRQVQDRTRQVASGRPKIVYFNRFVSGLKVAGPQTYNDYYIKLIGGTNPATGDHGVHGSGMVSVELEQVLAWDPDIILLGNFDAALPGDVYGDKRWASVSAVRSRRVYKVPLGGYRWDPPGQESPLMWSWLSRITFPRPDDSSLRATVTDYYDFLYAHRPTGDQLDKILWTDANRDSADYGQFAAE